MLQIKGHYASAVIYSQTAEDHAKAQVKMICDQPAAAGSNIRIMPDIHPGKIGPIGLTMTLGERILPGLLGVDIGCGISYIQIKNTKIEYQKLDRVIRDFIPTGSKIRTQAHALSRDFDFGGLLCRKHVDEAKAFRSLGTLGGGNHFIEVDRDEAGNLYVFVHSGSRRLGREVAEHYMREGQRQLKARGMEVPYELTWLEGDLMEAYLHDVWEVQGFAMLNREIILTELARQMKWKTVRFGESVHNYVDENRILRKGAAQAYDGDEVIIPVNMRDGILLGLGKGNPDWNFSVPHGAGRILNREQARQNHTVSEFREAMKGIHSPTICRETLDEAPFAYRTMEEILDAIGESASVEQILRPVYNYKAAEERK
ncbi:MAG: RtcB family protein [Anaerovoracaceae bacterium]|nr:RtcB family protein [Anaerovoracaceae bacterium]